VSRGVLWARRVGAVLAGFAVIVVLSLAADMLMRAAGAFSAGQMANQGQFAIAALYRAAFTVVGGYVTARLAPDWPLRHAWVLAGIGLAAGLGGIAAYFSGGGAEMGPLWYAVSIPLSAIPCVWLGARLARPLSGAQRPRL
jgi:hypothetical protein